MVANKKYWFIGLLVGTVIICVGIAYFPKQIPAKNDIPVLRLGTTTSTVGSGLFDVLLPIFEQKYKTKVKVFAKGTGAALQLARGGEVDVLLVHARIAENKFILEGYGINRRDVMYNEFILLGPLNSDIKIKLNKDVLKTLQIIANQKYSFLSRGDSSGTHIRELQLWKLLSIEPKGKWYSKSNKGMVETLKVASQEQKYVLSDLSTYLFNKDKLALEIIVKKDQRLFNPYGVIAVNPDKVKNINFSSTMQFIDFLTSKEGQEIINNFGKRRFGKSLFKPLALEAIKTHE